ncbi:MAG: MaoC family dehydratase [Fuerstiella sp.]|nr:MaoC family dehydratase [Fuerstiella sp.]
MTQLQFDDIDAINEFAANTHDFGEFGPSMNITQEMINTFADLTDDHQWIHVDGDRASGGPFGGTIAHGFLTLSLVPKLILGQLPIVGWRNIVNYGADTLRFVAPVPSGSSVHARGRLLKALEKDTGTLVKTSVAIHVVGEETPSVLYRMLTLYMS